MFGCKGLLLYTGEDLDHDFAQEEIRSLKPVLLKTFQSQAELHGASGALVTTEYDFGTMLMNVLPSASEMSSGEAAKSLAETACSDVWGADGCHVPVIDATLGAAASEDAGNAVGAGMRLAVGPEVVFGMSQKNLKVFGRVLTSTFSSSYVNEFTSIGDYNLIPDWQQRFWGAEKYHRLLAVKQKFDPCNMLGVEMSVGYGAQLPQICYK
jgi:hypothetical protein